MKSFRNFAVGAAVASAVLMFASCANDNATIECTIEGAPEAEIIVKQLNINRVDVLDTVLTNEAGHFAYKLAIEPEQPEFIYLFHNDKQIASLLLQRGEKAVVNADLLGNYTVTGSPESEKLKEVDRSYAEFTAKVNSLLLRFASYDDGAPEQREIQQEVSKEYIAYYRDRMNYVLSNPHSLAVVPILYQTVGENGMPLFSEQTDAIFFNNVCDSLETVYPGSPYVRALRQEASKRFSSLELALKMEQASESSFIDMELPDVQGVKRKLSEVEGKVILIHFWSSSVTLQKMFNIEVLQPVYEEYKDKGFEIYQVALDTDKATWARVVRDQGLGWINLCDGLGTSSPVIKSYNLTRYPTSFILIDGELAEAKFSTADELRSILSSLLR